MKTTYNHPPKPFPQVFLDVSDETSALGRIIISLYPDCPKTSENFRALCTGEKGQNYDGNRLHYKGTQFHRVLKKMLVQGGDVTRTNGTGGDSIYGKYFDDEGFQHKHNKPYRVAMANLGEKNTNSSQFYITSSACPWLDGMHVVFGEVVKGFDVVDNIQKLGTKNEKTSQKITITNCGELAFNTDDNVKNLNQGQTQQKPLGSKNVKTERKGPIKWKYNESIRNIAIIAHVDHGKTTLVDHMFKQSGCFRSNQATKERMMDNQDLERERGITISAKNCSVIWGKENPVRINILDTPGHADFGGEVERALKMVDGVILLVDAAEGPLPQTKFVLEKALKMGLKTAVLINKIDRKDADPEGTLDDIFDLFIDIGATEEQIEFPVLYAIGRDGRCGEEPDKLDNDLHKLFELIIKTMPPPRYENDIEFQMHVLDLDYSDYLGRLVIGPIVNGRVRRKDQLVLLRGNEKPRPLKVTNIQFYEGISVKDVEEAFAGDIIILSGIDDVQLGDTICNQNFLKKLPSIKVDKPTMSMLFTINTGPFSGMEGKLVQGNKIKERLLKESLMNVAIEVEVLKDQADTFIVKGRGEFQLAILIEQMRREGYEFVVGRPRVLFKENEKQQKLEPIEHLLIDVDEAYQGIVMQTLQRRKGILTNTDMSAGRVRLEFSIPTRSLIGYRNLFLTDTKGTGIMNSYLEGYEKYRGEFHSRQTGSIISNNQGKSVEYALCKIEPRGILFIGAGVKVYEGMIIGAHSKPVDLNVNPTKAKQLTNTRTTSKDDSTKLKPITPMILEKAIDFIKDDERIEITPKSIRMRKIVLDADYRKTRYFYKKKK